MKGCPGAVIKELDRAARRMEEVGVVVPGVPSEFSGTEEGAEGDGEGDCEINVVVFVGIERSQDGEE
jgi:hypothetical protein